MKTNNFKKRILVIMAFALLCCLSAKAQITPSVYAGLGNYTHLGGMVGIGAEIQYKCISVNAAIGYDHCNMVFSQKGYYAGKDRVGDNPFIGFDVGVKYYFYKGFFGGVNYGLLGKYCLEETSERVRVDNIYDFSFTLGYRWHYYKGLYGMAWMGATSNKEANRFVFVFDSRSFMPRAGLIIGYEFKH
jgi:hypothetical protein